MGVGSGFGGVSKKDNTYPQHKYISSTWEDKYFMMPVPVHCLLLRFFTDVLHDSFQGKQFTYRLECQMPVPEGPLLLWRERGYDPSATGVAFVMFDGALKEYTYPAYFWSE